VIVEEWGEAIVMFPAPHTHIWYVFELFHLSLSLELSLGLGAGCCSDWFAFHDFSVPRRNIKCGPLGR